MKQKLALGFSALFLTGCVGTPLPVTRAFVSVHDTVAPRYRVYVETDTEIDEATRANLIATIDEWTALVERVRPDVALPGVGR